MTASLNIVAKMFEKLGNEHLDCKKSTLRKSQWSTAKSKSTVNYYDNVSKMT